MRYDLLFLALSVTGACSPQARQRTPVRVANCTFGPISDSAVAGLPIGATVASVKEHCKVLEDTTALGEEALPQRTLLVGIGLDTLVAVIDSDRVWRIEVASPWNDRLRGSPVQEMRRDGSRRWSLTRASKRAPAAANSPSSTEGIVIMAGPMSNV